MKSWKNYTVAEVGESIPIQVAAIIEYEQYCIHLLLAVLTCIVKSSEINFESFNRKKIMEVLTQFFFTSCNFFPAEVFCFNVPVPAEQAISAEKKNVAIKQHNVIYSLIDDLRKSGNSRIPPTTEENIKGMCTLEGETGRVEDLIDKMGKL